MQSRGFNVKIKKLDPYLNVDPGTMNPFQHGEVFVTDDGAETDLDLGIMRDLLMFPHQLTTTLQLVKFTRELLARKEKAIT